MAERDNETSVAKGRKAAMRAVMALVAFLGIMALVFLANPGERYLWIKALHVIAVIAWMAGMLYLPRLFVYHCDAEPGSAQDRTFAVMERRLLKVIMTPAMIITWLAGLWLAWAGVLWGDVWFILKLAAVIVMSGAHGYFAASAKRFAAGTNEKTAGHWRLVNEVPTLAMIAAVVLVIVKPF